jgi:hypothetical protein
MEDHFLAVWDFMSLVGLSIDPKPSAGLKGFPANGESNARHL